MGRQIERGRGDHGRRDGDGGKRLDAAATAIYWHVKNKDDLVLMVGDHVWTEIDLPEPQAEDWGSAVTALATGLHAMFTRHPWLVQAFGSHLFYGEGKARFDDRILAVFEAGGFTGEAADRAAAAVFTFVLGSVLGGSATVSVTRRLARAGRDPQEEIRDTVAKAGEIARRFPRLRTRLESPAAGYNASPERTFEYGLRLLLHGLKTELTGDGTRATDPQASR